MTTFAPSQQALAELIASKVEGQENPDDRLIAAEVIEELGEEELRRLAQEELQRSVRRYLRGLTVRERPSNTVLGVPRSTRWDMVAQAADSGELDLARLMVHTGQEEKPLFDCMYGDLVGASDNHLRFAMANERFAEQYRDLAEMLLADDNARTVRDLPEERVKKVFSA